MAFRWPMQNALKNLNMNKWSMNARLNVSVIARFLFFESGLTFPVFFEFFRIRKIDSLIDDKAPVFVSFRRKIYIKIPPRLILSFFLGVYKIRERFECICKNFW